MPRKRLEKEVRKALGLEGKGVLSKISHPEVHRLLRPYHGKPYPTAWLFERSRVPKEYSVRGWNHLAELKTILLKDKSIRQLMERIPRGEKLLENAIDNALDHRAARAYGEEWEKLKPKDIDAVVGASTPLAKRIERGRKQLAKLPASRKANLRNADFILPEIRKKLARQKNVTLLDVGSGAGGTIIPILRQLTPAERKKIRVVLVDVMKRGLDVARERIVHELKLLPESRLVTVKTNFFYLAENPAMQQFKGKVDIVTSGAALHHTSNILPIFRSIYNLMKRNSVFSFWDWGHAAWKAPKLIAAPKRARVSKYGLYYELGRKTVEAPKEHAFISRGLVKGITRGRKVYELNTVKQMLETWVGLLHYDVRLRQKFVEDFKKCVRKGEPIDYAQWVIKNLQGVETVGGKKAGIKVWEGHRPPELYHDALKQAGFKRKPSTMYLVPESDLLYHMKLKKT